MTKPTWYRALSLAGLAGLCCFSCAEHPVTPLSEAFDRWHIEESQPLGTNRVDVLWVVDNSSSMLDEQAQLGREFASFVDALSLLGADVHLAAVSTDISEGGTFRRGPGDVIAKGCFSPPDDLATCGQRDPVLRTSDYKVDPNDPGSAIDAARLAAEGADVLVADFDLDAAQETAARLAVERNRERERAENALSDLALLNDVYEKVTSRIAAIYRALEQ